MYLLLLPTETQGYSANFIPFPKFSHLSGGVVKERQNEQFGKGGMQQEGKKQRREGCAVLKTGEKSTVWSTPSLAVHLQVTEGCHVSRRGLISHGGLAQMLLFMFSDADGNLCRSNQLLQVMLAMHRIIISSAELLQKVVTLYPLAQWLTVPKQDSFKSISNLEI